MVTLPVNILDTFNSTLTPYNKVLAKKTGVSSSQVSSVISQVAPVLLKQLARNSSTTTGARSLSNALSQDHRGDILNNIKDSILNANNGDGAKILTHILGSNQSNVVQNIVKKTGVTNDQTTNIMTTVAPLLMGVLGKQYTQTGQSGPELSGLLTDFLDKNRNGSIADDLINIAKSFFKK